MHNPLVGRTVPQALSMSRRASRVAALTIAAIAVHAALVVATGDPNATAMAEDVKRHDTSLAATLNAVVTNPAATLAGTSRAAKSRAAMSRDVWSRSASLQKRETPRPKGHR